MNFSSEASHFNRKYIRKGKCVLKLRQSVTLFICLLFFTACTEFKSSSSLSSSKSGSNASSQQSFIPAWSFISSSTIESILRVQLDVSGATAQEAALYTYLQAHQAELGVGNFSQGIPDNIRPEPVKFRYLTEIMSDACYLGLQKPRVHSSLFPNVGADNIWTAKSFDVIYLKAFGRKPSLEETAVFLSLVQATPSTGITPPYLKKAAAVCSVVFSSIEAANSR